MRLSIITINYNNKDGLMKTLNSVFSQMFFHDYEYIVIDGGSSDGSKTILQNSKGIDYWVSEPDRGIYHAMNKGIKVAQGDYCLFLNSGDVLFNETVLRDVFAESFSEDFVAGNHLSRQITKAPNCLTAFFLFRSTICHQSVLIKTRLLKELPYDENLQLVSDWKHMFVCLALNNASYRYINVIICKYDIQGISTQNWEKVKDERERVLRDLLPNRIFNDYRIMELQQDSKGYNPKLYEYLKMVRPGGWDEKMFFMIIRVKIGLSDLKQFLKRLF